MYIFCHFLQNIQNELTLWKEYFDSSYTNTIAKICDAVNSQEIWVCMDEAIDSVQLNVVNVINGILQLQDVDKYYLIHTVYLDKVN